MNILVIPDMQVRPNIDLSYVDAIGRYIVDRKPDVVVNLGDFADFESLSSYDKGKASFEGRRLKADFDVAEEAMKRLMAPLQEYQQQLVKNKQKRYNPRLVFTMGNHEERVDRFANDNPEFQGFVSTDMLPLEKYGWEVYPFLKPVNVGGIYFVHYLANPMTGRPYSGTAMSMLKTVGHSFVVGHKQTLDIAVRPVLESMQIGIVAGASYPHDEAYKGFQGNTHFRGVVMLHEVEDGFGLPMIVSTKYLLEKFT